MNRVVLGCTSVTPFGSFWGTYIFRASPIHRSDGLSDSNNYVAATRTSRQQIVATIVKLRALDIYIPFLLPLGENASSTVQPFL